MDTRFSFPGFVLVRCADSRTHEVEIGEIMEDGRKFVVHMIRRKGLSFPTGFLVAQVYDEMGNSLWKFPKSFHGIGILAKACCDETIIALVGKGKNGAVLHIVTFSSLIRDELPDIQRAVRLKREAADFLGREYKLTPRELATAQRMEAPTTATAQEFAYEARLRAREERVARIGRRPVIETYTADGRKRFGVPVVGNEWVSLPDGTHVVLVESYDENAGKIGTPMEAFRVTKERGKNPKKGFPSPVALRKKTNEEPAGSTPPPRPARKMIVLDKDNRRIPVLVFKTVEEIRLARAAGLNGGTYVASEDRRSDDGRCVVYCVRKNGVDDIGLCTPA